MIDNHAFVILLFGTRSIVLASKLELLLVINVGSHGSQSTCMRENAGQIKWLTFTTAAFGGVGSCDFAKADDT